MNKIIIKLKEYFEEEYTLKYFEIKGIVIVTMLSTLLLINIWPRFRNDVLEFGWYLHMILIAIFLLIWVIWRKHALRR